MTKLLVGRVSSLQSRRMAAIKCSDTQAELILRKHLAAAGLRYRLHRKELPGCPDIVFVTAQVAIFCDGDFWHGRQYLETGRIQKFGVRKAYWEKKIKGNVDRDRRNNLVLKKLGWKVLRYWETDILSNPGKVTASLVRVLATRANYSIRDISKGQV